MSSIRKPADKDVAVAINNINKKLDGGDTSVLKTKSGHVSLLGGIILQWGQDSVNKQGSVSVTFPREFPNDCLNIIATGYEKDDTGGGLNVLIHTEPTKTKVVISTRATLHKVFWQAIGY